MASNFIINLEDLNRILLNIKIAEGHAAGGNLLDIINQAAGGNAAAIVPFGLRTVDGSFNHLLPGDTLEGAADQVFPRLLDPVYRTTSGTFSLNGTPVVVGNNNYDPANPEAPGNNNATSRFSVVDAAPRMISNLIVDQTFNNKAALVAALAVAGAANPNADADAILAARDAALAEAAPSYLNFDLALTAEIQTQVDAALSGLTALADGLLTDGTYDNPGSDATNAALALAGANSAVTAAADLVAALSAPGSGATLADIANATQLHTDLTNLVNAITTAVGAASDGILLLSDYNAVVAARNAASALANTVDANQATLEFAHLVEQAGLHVSSDGSIAIPNRSADIGLSPPNSGWMTLFGQFFDHGLDLVTKGGNGTVFIPLQPDDVLYDKGQDGVVGLNAGTGINDDGWGADGVFGTADDRPNFMALTRATMFDANGNPIPGSTESQNTTTPFVDQNQTYTSSASHQVFLREYVRDVTGTRSTGHLLSNANGGIGTWGDVKREAHDKLGINLTDQDVFDVPQLVVDPYGKFIVGDNGYAQVKFDVYYRYETTPSPGSPPGTPNTVNYFLVSNSSFDRSGTAAGIDLKDADVNAGFTSADPPVGFVPPANFVAGSGDFVANAQRTGHAFLNDIAHDAAPNAGLVADNDGIPGGSLDGQVPGTYDGELLDKHFVTGDGRGNENIGLTAVHFIFHAEHDRAVEADKLTILRSGDINIIKEWLLDHNTAALPGAFPGVDASDAALKAYADTLTWDGERLFQAARFTTEMQYQHMVFEEFARRVQPNVDPFVFTNSADIDPDIVAEFAHTVYRFGHSMLTDSVDRLQNDLTTVNDDAIQIRLVDAFLNPAAFTNSGDGAVNATSDFDAASNIIRGMARQVGNEIDEFVVDSLRNFLVGLPLDLPALNLARGRDQGIPGLNDARAQLYAASGHVDVKPYTSWLDFGQHMKHPISLVNFIAAYGTHASILAETTIDGKRDAALKLVFGGTGAPSDRLDFLNARGAYAGGTLGGLNGVDLWIGGLAEEIKEFGGQLGSTFNFVFEYQLEQLQNGDRFYYLSRTQGMNLLNNLEANTFTDIIMRNTNLGSDLHATHMSAEIMEVPDMFLELDGLVKQANYSGDSGLDGADPANRALLDPTHEDPFLQAIDRKVMRVMEGVSYEFDGTNWVQVNVDVDGDGDFDANDNLLTFSGGEHVVLGGTENNDRIYGDKGIDTLWGDGGNDYLNAGMESDQVFGGDGDDIIEDPFGDDFLRGEAGDDVVVSASGIDVLFGGTGNDFVQIVTDPSEIFAGMGDDFLLGGSAPDALLGNEGDDWLEGGEGFDSLSGENSELFFNSPIVGHDILWGQANDTDYDGENGDDIMVQGSGIQRNNGMDGFDWAIHKGDTKADGTATDAVSDMTNLLGVGAVNPAFILRDRFDSVEGLSGWDGNDMLLGASLLVVAGGGFDSKITQAGVDRIDGLAYVIGSAGDGVNPLNNYDSPNAIQDNAPDAVVLTSDHAFNGGEIILGGAGSDTIMGALGDDILDGDAWLNVRISVHQNKVPVGVNNQDIDASNPEIFTVNSLTEVISGTGNPAWDGKSVADLMRTGVINPGQLKAVREILNSDGTKVSQTLGSTNDGTIEVGPGGVLNFVGDIDIAVFRDIRANYEVEGADAFLGIAGADLDGDGFIRVAHVPPAGGGGGAARDSDGVDHIRNFEILQFADTVEFLQPIQNSRATGQPVIEIVTDTGPLDVPGGLLQINVGDVLRATPGTLADADNITPTNTTGAVTTGITYTWQVSVVDNLGNIIGWEDLVDPVNGNVIVGETFTPTAAFALDGLSLRVVASFRDADNIPERRVSDPTDAVLGTAPVGPVPPVELGVDLTGVVVDGVAIPAVVGDPTTGILEDVILPNPDGTLPPQDTPGLPGSFLITREQLLTGVTDLDTPVASLFIDPLSVAPRLVAGRPVPGLIEVTDFDPVLGFISGIFIPAPNFNGGVVVDFDVSDGTTVVPLEATLEIIPVNDAPTSTPDALGTASAAAGAVVTFSIDALFGDMARDPNNRPIDVDGDRVIIDTTLVQLANPADGTLAFDPVTQTFTFTAAAGAIGDIGVVYTLDDGNGLANSTTVQTAFLTLTNDPPVVTGTLSATIGEDGPFAQDLTANAVDPNGTPLTVTGLEPTVTTDIGGRVLTSGIDYALAADGRTLQLTATGLAKFNSLNRTATDSFTLDYAVSDGFLSTPDQITVNVTGANDAPVVANALADVSSPEDNAVNFALPANAFSDVDVGDTLNYTAALASGAALPAWLSFNAATRTFSGTPPANFSGNLDIRVTASDGLASANDVFRLSITPVNDVPTGGVTISDTTPTQGQALNAANTLADADGIVGAIQYQWQIAAPLADGSLSPTATWTAVGGFTANPNFTPGAAQTGQYLRAVARYTDGGGTIETIASAPSIRVVGANIPGNPAATTVQGTAGDDIIAGGLGNDTVLGNGGDDVISWSITNTIPIILPNGLSDGRDFVDGGSNGTVGDRFVVNGNNQSEVFRIYTAAAAAAAGLTGLNANTEIVITRNTNGVAGAVTTANIIAELDNIEEITINGFDTTANDGNGNVNGGPVGADTIQVIGNFAPPNTSLNFSTITLNTGSANDVVDISRLTSDHRIVFNTGGGNDQIIGAVRPQDVVNTPAQGPAVTNIASNGDDTFNGIGAKFSFKGLGGNDVYIIDADDKVVESVAGGTDQVQSAHISLDLAKFANIENIKLTGDLALSAKGNGLANLIHSEGNTAGNVLTGLSGNDTYVIGAGDRIVETRNGGTDTASSSTIDLDLANYANVENLSLLGSAHLTAKGNSGANTIIGNAGNNTISGEAGNDKLTGRGGDDTFRFAHGFGNDRITDFDADANGGQDLLDLSALGISAENFAQRVHIIDSGIDTLVKVDGSSNTIRLEKVADHTSITINDFVLFTG